MNAVARRAALVATGRLARVDRRQTMRPLRDLADRAGFPAVANALGIDDIDRLIAIVSGAMPSGDETLKIATFFVWQLNWATLHVRIHEGHEHADDVARRCRMSLSRLYAVLAGAALPTSRKSRAIEWVLDDDGDGELGD